MFKMKLPRLNLNVPYHAHLEHFFFEKRSRMASIVAIGYNFYNPTILFKYVLYMFFPDENTIIVR